MAYVDWMIRTKLIGTCSCDYGCPCEFNAPPTRLPCEGVMAMEIAEPFRRRGFGSYLVQELKRAAYQLGSLPCARCSPDNVASRKTLQRAGLVPFAHILNGTIPG